MYKDEEFGQWIKIIKRDGKIIFVSFTMLGKNQLVIRKD